MKKPLIVIILGRAGSGKGTQIKMLAKKFGLEVFGSGDALRKRRKIKDFTGKKLARGMRQGKLTPTFLTANLWTEFLKKCKQKKNFRGLVFDGSPRRLIEAIFLEEAIDWYEWDKNKKFFLIDVSSKESFHRLTKRRQCKKCGRLIPWVGDFKKLKECDKCGGKLYTRTDDNPKAIKQRTEVFKKEVIPVIKHYKKKMVKINGEQSIEKVFKDILKHIK